ncbi:MAG: tRNA (guanosine(46)-N7)-methyltransferase TrmB [bacterium]|nr:tRNA (guanosine(46)-N7)-methyltransferase TrmB [bacterium]
MGRSLKYEIPGVDPRVALDVWAEKGWSGVFGTAAEAERRSRVLEIGFGRGEFLLDLATSAPDVEFVGVEVSFKRTLKMARKVARAALPNVRLVEARAEEAIRSLPEPGSLDAIWINFSDPWPKTRHAHRRVIQPEFVAAAAAALCEGGHLYVATDDVPYAHQMDEVLSAEPALQNAYAPWPFVSEVRGRRRTGYESQWREEGRPMHFFAYQRCGVERPDG